MKRLILASDGGPAIDGMVALFEDVRHIKLAFIITASKGTSSTDYLERDRKKMTDMKIQYEEVDIEGKTEKQMMEIFKDKNAIYVEGGNTFYLLKAIRESGFDRVIRKLIKKGVIYIGSSAGSYVACPTIEVATWRNQNEQKKNFGVTDLNAMNLVPFLIKAHYVSEMEDLVKEKISQTPYITKILKDGQAIIVEDDNCRLIGNGEMIEL